MRAADTSRQPEKASNHVPAPPAARREEPPRRDSAAPWGQSDARLARSGLALRRLRYFHDLLTSAFTASQSADLTSGTLRTERIALAIDRPELDAVALWTARRDDGAVAIPFVEYLLGGPGRPRRRRRGRDAVGRARGRPAGGEPARRAGAEGAAARRQLPPRSLARTAVRP
jgi:hypothetical protein